MKNLLNKCEICEGLFGTHRASKHLEKILHEIETARIKYPDMWDVMFNKQKLRQETDKWMLYDLTH